MSSSATKHAATSPRIPPANREELSDKGKEYLAIVEGPDGRKGGSKSNIVMTLAHHPDLALPYFNFGHHVLGASTLPGRVREIATLRTAWLHHSDYQWNKHAASALKIGVTQAEVDATKTGADDPVWSASDQYIIRAVDQLKHTTAIDDETWQGLAQQLDQKQLLDFVFTVGHYAMLAMFLQAVRVQEE